jgi:SNF2 family DNA or RNA helicase
MSKDVTVKLITTTEAGNKIKSPVIIRIDKGRIWFVKSPFSLKDEIKAMKSSIWHGYKDPPQKMWSVLECERNRFQLQWLMGKNPYEWWEQSLKEWEYERPLRSYQELMSNHMLTYHYCIIAAEMGLGKTLSAIECIEKSGKKNWWWIGPKSGLKAVEREFHKWGLDSSINLTVMTYEKLRNVMTHDWTKDTIPPDGVFLDESSRLKNSGAKRTIAAQLLADAVREAYGKKGYVVLMSGTPSPKSPVDWWAQAEIAWPGFLREGEARAFERRLGVYIEKSDGMHKFFERVTWLDDENKCKHCGGYANEEQHDPDICAEDLHEFESSFNEVSYLYERLEGLVLVLHKKDCIDLPEKQYRQIVCDPTPTIKRVARALVKIAPNVITGLTWMRELSDGFQYQDKVDGTEPCPVCEDGTMEIWVDPDDSERKFEMVDMLDPEYIITLEKQQVQCSRCKGKQEIPKIVRTVKEVPCPKDDVVKQLLEENEEQGRLVIFAGFKGSIDRITNLCLKQHWAVVRVDGRGWYVFDYEGNNITKQYKPLDYWADVERFPRVTWVAHPKSGGLSLTLTEARMIVYFSNDFNPESRSQSEDRIHRMGMDENKGATIVDIIHLPTDAKVLSILQDNRRLELMTLGGIEEMFGEE